MSTYFISDLHLCPEAPHLAVGFKRFMAEHAEKADALYILGDFFNAWIGDDEDHPFYLDILSVLKDYSSKGLYIAFMHGNRDFLAGTTFAEKSGAVLLAEPSEITACGKRIVLMHGDSLCTTDTQYMAFRAQVRNPAWQAQILGMPLAQRRMMAEQLRAQSSSMNSNKAEDIMDVNPDDVIALFESTGADILLHGHTHRPARHPLTLENRQCERIVLGDWGKTAWYVRANDTSIELAEFTL